MSWHDISDISTPQTAVTTVSRAKDYLRHMVAAGKSVDHVALRAGDYDSILRSVNAARKRAGHSPARSLCIGTFTVTRGPR